MEKEYIQLPALKRDLDPDVVKALWVFIQLPEEYQARYQEQYELLNQRKEEADRQLQENIEKIDADAIHLYEETMRSMICLLYTSSEILMENSMCRILGESKIQK